jgi:hypothetical protein
MQKFSRGLFKEILGLIISLILTTLIALSLFGKILLNGNVDIHFLDTYFVLSTWFVLTSLFISVTFIVYLIVTRIRKFKTIFNYWVLMQSGFLLVVSLTMLIKTFAQLMSPTISGLEPNKISELNHNFLPLLIANSLTVIQLIVLGITLIITYRFGKRKQIQNL